MNPQKLLQRTRKRARRKNIPFNLDVMWLMKKLSIGKCEATGIQFKMRPSVSHLNPYLPSIDRVDSSKGYTKDNCQVVIIGYNNMKSNNSEKLVKEFCESFVKIYEEKNK